MEAEELTVGRVHHGHNIRRFRIEKNMNQEEKMLEEITYKLKKRLFRHMEDYDITLEDLKTKQLEGAEIVDVRSTREHKENPIKGSINIPEYEINESFTNIVPNKEQVIVVYCSSGFRSTKAYKKLKQLGYSNVYNLYGGLENY